MTLIFFFIQRIILICLPLLVSSSAITCLQFPHGETLSAMSPFSVIAVMAMATGLSSGKFETAAAKAVLSAQVPEGKAAFSTFEPCTILPDSSLTAAPTLNFEYGA